MRKTKVVTIDTDGRDKGKVFHLTEMPASKAEEWAYRLLLAISNTGVNVPAGFLSSGMAGVAVMGANAMGALPWQVAKPLLDEMMICVRIQPGPNPTIVRDLIDDDIEEVWTRLRLRDEVIELHTGFSVAGYLSELRMSRSDTEDQPGETGQNTETFGLH